MGLMPESFALVDVTYLASIISSLWDRADGVGKGEGRWQSVEVLSVGGAREWSARESREAGRLIYNAKWISQGGDNDRQCRARLILNL